MIKKIKNFICKLFRIKQCECPTDMDPHEELYLHTPKSDVPIHVEETAKQKKIREKHKGDK
tara:strand:+ start:336 stop:518 length:183 start_codon:yes stop_codon:yes gene_type:complete